MKTVCTMALAGFGLLSLAGAATAQRYDDYDRGDRYDRRGDRYDRRGDRDDDRYGDRDGYGDRVGRSRNRDDDGFGRRRNRDTSNDIGFDAGEYLRCNPDVARAVRSGQMPSAIVHFRTFGRREGRRLSC